MRDSAYLTAIAARSKTALAAGRTAAQPALQAARPGRRPCEMREPVQARVCAERSVRRRVLRAPMDIVPGNVQYAGVTHLVRSRRRRRLDHRFANIPHRAVIDPAGGREEAAAAILMAGERRESRARRSKARTARGARIGGCLARGKDKRDGTERRDKHCFIGHGTHPLEVTEQHSQNAKPCLSCPQSHT